MTSTSSRRICSRPRRQKCGWVEPEVIARSPAHKLDKSVFRHPFLERDSLGILGDHVTLEQGTGAVHTAPGHGQEDYVIGHAIRPAGLLPGRCRRTLLPGRRRAGTAARAN